MVSVWSSNDMRRAASAVDEVLNDRLRKGDGWKPGARDAALKTLEGVLCSDHEAVIDALEASFRLFLIYAPEEPAT